jgi:hypothetical protein
MNQKVVNQIGQNIEEQWILEKKPKSTSWSPNSSACKKNSTIILCFIESGLGM